MDSHAKLFKKQREMRLSMDYSPSRNLRTAVARHL